MLVQISKRNKAREETINENKIKQNKYNMVKSQRQNLNTGI